jgi:hypothetical protein
MIERRLIVLTTVNAEKKEVTYNICGEQTEHSASYQEELEKDLLSAFETESSLKVIIEDDEITEIEEEYFP